MTLWIRKRKSEWWRAAAFLLLVAAITVAISAAQTSPSEHVFQISRSELEKVLQNLHVYSPGRLPILDGFVAPDVPALDKYQRAYFQYKVEIHPSGTGATSLRVSAKVTAWYTGDNAAQAGYRALPSNGRLEMDLIERLEETLQQHAASVAEASTSNTDPAPASAKQRTAPMARSAQPEPARSSSFGANLPLEQQAARSSLAAPDPRERAQQKRVQQLTEQAANLEEILRNQARPNDLVAVLKTGTPVLAKPVDYSEVLFKADAEDEFKVLDESGDWVHVQVSGISRGWIRRSELEMPGAANEIGSKTPRVSSEPATHEEISLFPGEWSALRGRMVRIAWVRPESVSGPGGSDRWQLARSVFRDAYGHISQSSSKIEGVVIVIDAADGGMIAATADALRRWNVGAISDAAFRKECWTDSPEALGETARREGKPKSQD
jgi:hypothetical protein